MALKGIRRIDQRVDFGIGLLTDEAKVDKNLSAGRRLARRPALEPHIHEALGSSDVRSFFDR
jgi:hypothetical protein